jgi:peptidoglycan/LPS O-acetylase OafA/YrhL
LPTSASALSPRFRPELEGLRAVAILAVVLYHAGVPGFSGGYVGVDVFFVLSGYLITELLLVEVAERGAVDLADFYGRRVRRLMPAGLLLILAVVAAGAAGAWGTGFPDLEASAIGAATYTSNLHFITASFAYFDAGVEHNPLVHTWSLGVEAQFYVVWPLIIGLVAPRRGWLVAAVAGLLAASLAASVVLTKENLPLAFYGLPTRVWELATGALLAILRERTLQTPLRGALAIVGLAAIAVPVALYDRQTLFPGWAAIPPVGGTSAVLLAASAGSPLQRALAWKPLQTLGGLSYSWYLWHWPLLAYVALTPALAGPLWRPAAALAALGVAALSYRFVELPVRRSRFLRERAGLTLALGAAGAGGVCAAAWLLVPASA